ncbi:hypothetical protein G7Z17_g9335 [Cylindrodendrum hubeiense]|uniref:Heterokaryon incompatibility domain-containing protein n=1 Tax=Cylindrodendrum hubeiense TaxID=595255 RepID=A0A9P5LDS7_9HYPO|nr:hypothetical protein G7Z17_g9335 [Cylindrodendrum hubeiense]
MSTPEENQTPAVLEDETQQLQRVRQRHQEQLQQMQQELQKKQQEQMLELQQMQQEQMQEQQHLREHPQKQQHLSQLRSQHQSPWGSETFREQASKWQTPWMDSSRSRALPTHTSPPNPSQPIQSAWSSERFRDRVAGCQAPWMDPSRSRMMPTSLAPVLSALGNQSQLPPVSVFRFDVNGSRPPWMDSSRSGLTGIDTAPVSHASRNRRKRPQSDWESEHFRGTVSSPKAPWMGSSRPTTNTIGTAPRNLPSGTSPRLKDTPIANTPSCIENPTFHPYIYRALPGPAECRILRLLPGRTDDPIKVEVIYATLDAIFKYSAMSRLRHGNEPRMVWADAACINQNDEDEKGRQVRLMRLIFQKASKVIIWLGQDETDSAKLAFALINQIYQKNFQHVPPPDHPTWVKMCALFNTQWFWRLWCLQEVALASTAEVMWGSGKNYSMGTTWICCCVDSLRAGARTPTRRTDWYL